MTAPVSLDLKPPAQGKSIPYEFLHYQGSWFYLVVASVLGLFWIAGLIEAIKMGAFDVEHFQDARQFSLGHLLCFNLVLDIGVNSVFMVTLQLKFSKQNPCSQQVGPNTHLGFLIIGWFNFVGWLITGLLGFFTLPASLLIPLIFDMYCIYGMAPYIGFLCTFACYIWRRRSSRTNDQQLV